MRQARWPILLLVLAAAGVPVPAQRRPIDQAWDLLAKGERAAAAQVLQQIIRTNPGDASAHMMLGSLLAEDGKGPEAVAELEQAVRLRPRWAEAHHALGAALRDSANAGAARGQFEIAVGLDPTFAQARVDLGLALLVAGEAKAASVHLDQAIRIFGRNPEAAYPAYLRAKIHSDNSETAQAAKLLELAVSLRPDFAEAWSDLGLARKNLAQDAAALAAFERSVKADPANAVAQYRLGAELLRQGDAHRAVAPLRQSFDLNPKDQSTLYSLQLALRQDGQVDESKRIRAALADVLHEIDRESQNAFNALRLNNEGAALEKAGDLAAACDKYRQALALDPAHVGIRVNFAVAALRLGRWREGIAELREALRRDPANAQVKAALADALKQAPAGSGQMNL